MTVAHVAPIRSAADGQVRRLRDQAFGRPPESVHPAVRGVNLEAPYYWEELDGPGDEPPSPVGVGRRVVRGAYARRVTSELDSALTGQQQRSLVTQDKILDAAVTALIEHGYSGASTLRVQEIAGVSRGRLLHQFPNRDALLVAAVQHLAIARVEAVSHPRDWPDTLPERVDAAVDAMWANYQQDYFWAATELWMGARHNPELRDALLPAERSLYRKIRSATDGFFGSPLNERTAYPSIRETLNTSMRGVALTYAFDRRRAGRDPHLPAWKSLARHCLLPEG